MSETLSNAIYNICHGIYFAALAFIKFSGNGAEELDITTKKFKVLDALGVLEY